MPLASTWPLRIGVGRGAAAAFGDVLPACAWTILGAATAHAATTTNATGPIVLPRCPFPGSAIAVPGMNHLPIRPSSAPCRCDDRGYAQSTRSGRLVL